ncbi:hypothetical protein [Vibrio anguillarum]|uniref:hypothetical protein n=1 Tax=Vibrio anguillarum TaxID=55601 RepID=UPI003CE67114
MLNEQQQASASENKNYTWKDLCGALGVGAYLLSLLIVSIWVWYLTGKDDASKWVVSIKPLRAVYLNYSQRKQWDSVWLVWYLFRPITSGLMGYVTYLVITAGLVAVGSTSAEHPETLLYALSFFSGLNVDGFLKKFEGQISRSMKVKGSRQTEGS